MNGFSAVLLSKRGPKCCRRVYVQDDVVLPPREQTEVTVRSLLTSISHSCGTDYTLETRCVQPGVYVGRTLLPPSASELVVHMINTTETPRLVRSGTCLGFSEPVQTIIDSHRQDETSCYPEPPELNDQTVLKQTDSDNVVDQLADSVPHEIEGTRREQVRRLFHSYRDVFSVNEYDVGRTDLVSHRTETGDHKPIRQTLRRHPVAYLDTIDRQVDDMLKYDLIEPAASPWASNVVLVRKKDGTVRFCVDYRSVNSVTRQDSYPLPHIDSCLDALKGSTLLQYLRSPFRVPQYPRT